jgi:hypothetical protein
MFWKVRAMPRARRRCAAEGDPARRERKQARDEIDHRALARAVRPDQPEDAAFLDRQRELVDGTHAAEVPGNLRELEHR